MEYDVSIIIVSYNTKNLLNNCINSIIKNTYNINYEIIVVDNNSRDGSVDMVKNQFNQVKVIENFENYGFAKANNIGIKEAKGKYLFFLNSDAILLNNAIKYFYDWMENNNLDNSIGAIGSYLLNTKREIIHSYGNFPNFLNILKNEFINSQNNFELKIEEKEVDYITGADLFIPRKVIDEIGFFDENFFLYYEETDLQKRMKDRGFKRILITEPKIIHLEGKSLKFSISKRIIFDKSKFIYLKKYNNKISYFFFKHIYLFIRITKELIKRRYSILEIISYYKTILKI